MRLLHCAAYHWLFCIIFLLSILFAYTGSPLYSADPTPTPNVATVPKLVFTPTPLPTKPVVIITQGAVTTVQAPVAEAPNVSAAPTNIASAIATANDAPVKQDRGLSTPADIDSSSLLTPLHTISIAISMQPLVSIRAFTTTPLIWQGAVRRFQFVVYNHSTYNLTHLKLQYLSINTPEIANRKFYQAGGTVIHQITGLLLRWPQLAPDHSTTVTITIRVRTDAPNGFPCIMRCKCAIAIEYFTLIMPPAELPSFHVHSR